jgi:hypothetical protein
VIARGKDGWMRQTRVAKIKFEENKRVIRLRWLGSAENDLRELKMKRWRQNTNNREHEVLGATNRLLSFHHKRGMVL